VNSVRTPARRPGQSTPAWFDAFAAVGKSISVVGTSYFQPEAWNERFFGAFLVAAIESGLVDG
jgi:hypothetical protein